MSTCALKPCCHSEIARTLSDRKRNMDIFLQMLKEKQSAVCYLVDVIGVDACVKAHVEVVEHLHHLQRSTGCRDRSEAHNV